MVLINFIKWLDWLGFLRWFSKHVGAGLFALAAWAVKRLILRVFLQRNDGLRAAFVA